MTVNGALGSALQYKAASSLTAHAGGGQSSALALTSELNFVTTVASSGDSVKLPVSALGKRVIVVNDGANAMDIFPASGGTIDALSANAAYSLAAGSVREFLGKSATLWRSR